MTIEIFNRFEAKYLLSDKQFMQFESAIQEYMVPDSFNKQNELYTVSNVYFDTDNFDLIKASIEKPLYKEKLRIRAYGIPKIDDVVFCEIKKKYKGKVNKRRSRISLNDSYDFLASKKLSEIKPNMNKQVLSEIEFMLNRYDLKPKVYIAYDRKAYFCKNDKKLRISFDSNIRSRFYDLRLEMGTYGELLLNNNIWLMEIKCFNMPLWLARLLSDFKIYPQSFSKYGNIYKKNFSSNFVLRDADLEVASTIANI